MTSVTKTSTILNSIILPGKGVTLRDISENTQTHNRVNLTGIQGGSLAAVVNAVLNKVNKQTLIVVKDSQVATNLHRDLIFQSNDLNKNKVLLFPPLDMAPYDELVPDRTSLINRAGVFFQLALGTDWKILIVSADGLLRKVVSRHIFEEACLPISVGDEINRDHLISLLERTGYNKTSLVEERGTYAVRGSLIDVFVPYLEQPARIELFGNEVEQIRLFDVETQSTQSTVSEMWIHPSRLILLPANNAQKQLASTKIRTICDKVDQPTRITDQLIEDLLVGRLFVGSHIFAPAFNQSTSSLFDFLPKKLLVYIDDPSQLSMTWNKLETLYNVDYQRRIDLKEPSFELENHILKRTELEKKLSEYQIIAAHHIKIDTASISSFENCKTPLDLNAKDTANIGQKLRALYPAGEKFDLIGSLSKYLTNCVESGYRVVLVAHTQGQVLRLLSMLKARDLEVKELDNINVLPRYPGISISRGEMARGYILPSEALCFIAEEEIFGRRSRIPKTSSKARSTLNDLRSLKVGDLVVHKEHGVGKYEGLVRRKIRNSEVDFLLLIYKDSDKLYLPVYRVSQVQKYRSGGDNKPRLDRLGGQSFFKTKVKAKKAAMDLAAKLLDMYARREVAHRPPIDPEDELYREFEASFPFEETVDQAQTINDVMGDLKKSTPMDRLICGDVGFGKTEIAIRAAFRVVMSGRQVAVLVPTTILAQQHFLGLQKRFKPYPINVAMVSRFRTVKQNSETVMGLKDGTVDIVIGTHRLLSKDVHLKRLGLLVIDEEHRFGVTHKERIRSLKASVDTMVLTATPIPRTLHMAFAGMRDLSLIGSAPVDRLPIKTMICHDDAGLLKEAMQKELAREGQVYYLHNRVKDIHTVADKIRKMMPDARIAVGHGQMKEAALEQVMMDFVSGRYDILVCTAIIESGLDIPRANTIIIDRADTFGLGQLYQIRGRVGRSSKQAFAYLVVPPLSTITDDARQRVEALTEHTQLGSGFSIATLDLEIRGAGNLLGSEQSGDVTGVGFEMYCELIAEASAELRGEKHKIEFEPEMTFEVPGLLPEDYMPDVGLRLQYYKRLASCDNEKSVQNLAAELFDRFGSLPDETENLISGMAAKALCRKLEIVGLEASEKKMTIFLSQNSKVDPNVVFALIRQHDGFVQLTKDLKIIVFFQKEAPNGADGAIRFLRSLDSCEIKID